MTVYYPESDTLDCGCNPDWPDHRCRYGCSRCGAPDDCYCPSPAEVLDMTISRDLIYPVRLLAEAYSHRAPGLPMGRTDWICYTRSDLIVTMLNYDPDLVDFTIYDANGTREKI